MTNVLRPGPGTYRGGIAERNRSQIRAAGRRGYQDRFAAACRAPGALFRRFLLKCSRGTRGPRHAHQSGPIVIEISRQVRVTRGRPHSGGCYVSLISISRRQRAAGCASAELVWKPPRVAGKHRRNFQNDTRHQNSTNTNKGDGHNERSTKSNQTKLATWR